jgi:preprotein translocase subunit SecA
MTEDLQADAQAAYDRRIAEVGDEVMRELERRVVLSVLDRKWREHLYEMDYLREGIYLRAYSQRDPLVEYQREGFDMFTAMMNGIKEESVGFLFNLEVSVDDDVDDDEDAEVIEVEEPMRQEVPAFGEPAAPAPEVPHIRAKGLERPSQPQRLTYSGPEEGVGEVGDDNAAVSSTVTNEGDPYAGVGRNAECPCGSGKKFKKCHGAPGGPTGLTARANG